MLLRIVQPAIGVMGRLEPVGRSHILDKALVKYMPSIGRAPEVILRSWSKTRHRLAKQAQNRYLRSMSGQHLVAYQRLGLIESDLDIVIALLCETLRHKSMFAFVVKSHLHHDWRVQTTMLHTSASHGDRAGAGVVIEMATLIGMSEDGLDTLRFKVSAKGRRDGGHVAKRVLIADGKGMTPLGANIHKVQHPRELRGARLRMILTVTKARSANAANIAPRAIGEVDRMSAAQQFQQGAKANGFIIRMGHDQRDGRVETPARAEVTHDAMSTSG